MDHLEAGDQVDFVSAAGQLELKKGTSFTLESSDGPYKNWFEKEFPFNLITNFKQSILILVIFKGV